MIHRLLHHVYYDILRVLRVLRRNEAQETAVLIYWQFRRFCGMRGDGSEIFFGSEIVTHLYRWQQDACIDNLTLFFAQRLSQPPYRWQLVARIDKLTFLLLLLLAQRLSPPLSRWQLVARIDNWTLFARISSRLSYIVTRMYWWSHAFVAQRSSPPSCCTYNLTLFWLRQRHHLCVALTDNLTLILAQRSSPSLCCTYWQFDAFLAQRASLLLCYTYWQSNKISLGSRLLLPPS